MNLFRTALRRLRPALFAFQALANLLLFAAAILWLRIPDAYSWQVAASAFGALAIAALLLLTHHSAMRALRQAPLPARRWLGALTIAVWLLLGAALAAAIELLRTGADRRAGYWNSKLSAHLRATLTHDRLLSWQDHAIGFLLWVVLPGILLPLLMETSAREWRRPALTNGARVLLRWQHWLAVLVISNLLTWMTPRILDWHPVDSVSGEIVSAALRLPFVSLVDLYLVLLVLAIDGVLLSRVDTRGQTVAQPLPDRI